MEPLRIQLFGGFVLEHGSRALPPIPSLAGRSLLAFLALNRDRPHARGRLAGMFWPDLTESRARRRLSHALWQIQDALGEISSQPYVLATTDTLAFNDAAPYLLDTEEFQGHLARLGMTGGAPDPNVDELSELRRAVDLYRGDFMAGFYDEWVALPQQQFREMYLAALDRVVQVAKSRGNHEEALAYARRLTHHDPLREPAHREVIRLCFLLGRTGEALGQYERCRSVLAEELGTEPSPETEELYQKIIRHRRSGIRPAVGSSRPLTFDERTDAPFVGREAERRSLVDGMERALSGRGGVILVEGEPGIGKSRLVSEASDDAEWRGFDILWGTCLEGSSRPYGPLVEALDSGLTQLRAEQLAQQLDGVWLREVCRLVPRVARWFPDLPVTGSLPSGEARRRIQEALARAFVALGKATPHILVLDDLQWADDETLQVMERLGPHLESTRLVVLLLYRSEEARGDPRVWDVLRNLDRVAGLGRIVLTPLSVFELGELVKRTLGISDLEATTAARLHRDTGGNALFTLETLHALRDEGLVDERTGALTPEAQARLGTEPIPVASRIRSVVEHRTGLLDSGPRAVLEAASASPWPLRLGPLAAAVDLSRAETLAALDDLLARRLLQETDGTFGFAHDQVRQVVYEAIPGRRRAALHRRLAEAVADDAPTDAERLAFHTLRGGLFAEAAEHLRRAGEQALAVHAADTAAERFRQALDAAERAGWETERRLETAMRLEEVLDVLGRRDDQERILGLLEELAGTDPASRAEVARRRAMYLANTDRFVEAVTSAEEAVALGRELEDPATEAAALVALGLSLRWSGRVHEAVPHLERAAELASDVSARAEALTALANALTELQEYGEAAERLREAARLFAEAEDLRGQAETLRVLATGAMEQGRTTEARRCYEESLELCRRIGYRYGEGVTLVNLANLLYVTGRVADALAHYDAAADAFAAIDHRRGLAMVQVNSATVRHEVLGDDTRAEADARAALAFFTEIGEQAGAAQCLDVLAGVAARRGDPEEARGLLRRSLADLKRSEHRWLAAQHLRSLARLELDADDPDAAAAALEQAALLCAEAGLDDLGVEVDSLRAAVAAARGETEAAYARSAEAVARLGPGVEHPELVWLRHGEIALAAGDRLGAIEAFRRAFRTLEGLLGGLPPDQRTRALAAVPEYGRIAAEWERLRPTVVEIDLPRAGTPTGRPLRPEELVTVRWTVETGEDDVDDDPVAVRRHRLARLLTEAQEQGAEPTLEHLAGVLAVSPATVRRDLAALRDTGLDLRTRGRRGA